MINNYWSIWPQQLHNLAPLTALTSAKVKWKWTDKHQTMFNKMKRIMTRETLLAYPNFKEPFHIHTDASLSQLGTGNLQDKKPIALYSHELNPAQTRYTTTERELLSIVEILKKFRNILLGQEIHVHTDHENLTYKMFNSDRVMRWRLYIKAYFPGLKYRSEERRVGKECRSR